MKNLQKVIDVFHNLNHNFLVAEYFKEGNVIEYMLNKGVDRLELPFAVQIIADIICGVCRLHEK